MVNTDRTPGYFSGLRQEKNFKQALTHTDAYCPEITYVVDVKIDLLLLRLLCLTRVSLPEFPARDKEVLK